MKKENTVNEPTKPMAYDALLCALKTSLGYEVKIINNRLMMYEQDLPEEMTQQEYNEWYYNSSLVDGVRMGGVFIAS